MGNYKLKQVKVKTRTQDYPIYIVEPSVNIISNYLKDRIIPEPFTIQYILMSKFNFTAEEYYQYLISNFNATVEVLPVFPFFKVYFKSYEDGLSFLAELEKRSENQFF